jgi:hypothetical protein
MPVSNQFLIKGITPTNCSQATLTQLVDAALPYTDKGMVIVSNDTPDVSTYPSLGRCLWVKPSEYNATVRRYNTNSSSWEVITIGASGIGTSQLADLAVTPAKLYAPGAAHSGKQLIVNASGNFELTLYAIADNSVAITKLSKGSGNASKLIRVAADNSSFEFFTLNAINYIADGAINPVKLNFGANSSVIVSNASGVPVVVTISSLASLFSAGVLAPAKITPGNESQQLVTRNGVAIWENETNRTLSTTQIGTNQNLPAAAGTIVIAHGLSGIPRFIDLRLVCIDGGGDAGYALNDEVDFRDLSYDDTDNVAGMSVKYDSTNITFRFTAGTLILQHATTGAETAITRSKWQVKAHRLTIV